MYKILHTSTTCAHSCVHDTIHKRAYTHVSIICIRVHTRADFVHMLFYVLATSNIILGRVPTVRTSGKCISADVLLEP